MAQIIPVSINNSVPQSEKTVLEHLKKTLSDDYVIIHSANFSYAQKHAMGRGEIDFVVFHKYRGVLFLEVKGGQIQYLPTNEKNKWKTTNIKGEVKPIKNPFEQAKKAQDYFVERFRIHKLNLPVEYAVIFPDCSLDEVFINGAIPQSFRKRMVGEEFFSKTEDFIHSQLSVTRRKEYPQSAFESFIESIKPEFELIATYVNSTLQKIEQLSEGQAEVVYHYVLGSFKGKHLVIPGSAGTGKTYIARFLSEKWTSQGMKVLLLCHNRNLVNFLKDNVSSTIEVNTFETWFSRSFGYRWNKNNKQLIIQAVSIALDIINYDYVIIDEAQDFDQIKIDFLNEIFKNKQGFKFAVYLIDPHQDVLHQRNELLDGKKNKISQAIKDNVRNTKPIHDYIIQDMQKILGYKLPYIAKSNDILGKEPFVVNKLIVKELYDDFVPKLIKMLDKDFFETWTDYENFCSNPEIFANSQEKYEDTMNIVHFIRLASVLRIHKEAYLKVDKSEMSSIKLIVLSEGKVSSKDSPVMRLFNHSESLFGEAIKELTGLDVCFKYAKFDRKPTTVLFETLHSFKGLEADCVVFFNHTIGLNSTNLGSYSTYKYTACSRAKLMLYIIEILTLDERRALSNTKIKVDTEQILEELKAEESAEIYKK